MSNNNQPVQPAQPTPTDTPIPDSDITSDAFRKLIISRYVRPNFESDLKNVLLWKDRWATIAGWFYCCAEAFGLFQTITSATNSAFNIYWLSYLGVLFGLLAIGFTRIGAYASQKNAASSTEETQLLASIGIKDNIPDTEDNVQPNTTGVTTPPEQAVMEGATVVAVS